MSDSPDRAGEALEWLLGSLYLMHLTRYEGIRDGWLTVDQADLLSDEAIVELAEANR